MEIKVDVPDRLYKQLIEFCQANDLSVDVYLFDKIERGFSIDRFGDLNILSGNKTIEQVEKENENLDVIKTKDIKDIKDVYYDDKTKSINLIDSDNNQYFIPIKQIGRFNDYFIDKVDTSKVIEEIKEKTKISRRQIKSK